MSAAAKPAEDTRILVPVTGLPHLPLILCDEKFLTAVSAAEQRVGALIISDNAALQVAANLLGELTTSAKQLDDMRLQLKRPFLTWGEMIDTAAKAPKTRLENLKQKVRTAMANFAVAERQRLDKLEAERQAEIKRLEVEAERQRKEADEKAAAEAAKVAPVDLAFEDDDIPAPEPAPKTAIEQRIEQLKYAPAAPAPKIQGARVGVRLAMRVTDVAKLPDAYVIRTANEALIRATYCVGYKEGAPIPTCPGVEFMVEHTAASTGRGTQLF